MLPDIGEWVSQPIVVQVFLLSIRLSAVFLMTPILYAAPLPPTARILLVLALAIALALGHSHDSASPALVALVHEPGKLLLAVLTEGALGALLALGILLAFAAFSFAGTLLDLQIGFGMASVYDPVSKRPLPVLTNAFNQFAILMFFLVDGHHALMRGLAFSLERFPLGQAWDVEPAVQVLMKKVGAVFGLGFSLAAPVVCCLLLVEFALGVISRNLPQMNTFVVGVPAKIAAGLLALALWHAGAGGAMLRVYQSIYTTWDQLFSVNAAGEAYGR
jgi:flagellar biosynthetic protein FliR